MVQYKFTNVSEDLTASIVRAFACRLLLVNYLMDPHIDPEDDGRIFLRNVGEPILAVG
jgi:hypothetical protein